MKPVATTVFVIVSDKTQEFATPDAAAYFHMRAALFFFRNSFIFSEVGLLIYLIVLIRDEEYDSSEVFPIYLKGRSFTMKRDLRKVLESNPVGMIRRCLLLLCGAFLLAGCQSNPQAKIPEQEQLKEKIDISSLSVGKGICSGNENACTYYTTEEAGAIVSESTAFVLQDDCYFRVPKEINHASTFVKKYPEEDNLYEFYRDFLSMYAYLFPGSDFDDNHLFYFGANSNNQEGDDKVKTIGRNFEEYLAEDKEDVYYLFYSPYFYEGQPVAEGTQNRFLELSSPVGTIMTNFNKGYLAQYISDVRQTPNRYFLETYTSPQFNTQNGQFFEFDSIEYPTDSEALHRMLDGRELSVRDAVHFFEDYINTLPYPKQPNLDVKVTRVSAVEIEEGKYCYAFEYTVMFEGIPFDSVPYGTMVVYGGYEWPVRMGYMAVTDDVDAAYGFCRSVEISEKEEIEQIVSFQEALTCCEESLTGLSGMELCSAELVYCAGEGRTAQEPYQNMEYTVSPNYKFVLYSPEENLYYFSYVDAVDGEIVRDFTTRMGEREEETGTLA